MMRRRVLLCLAVAYQLGLCLCTRDTPEGTGDPTAVVVPEACPQPPSGCLLDTAPPDVLLPGQHAQQVSVQGVQMTDKLTAAVKHPGFYQAYVKAFAMVRQESDFCIA